jgi:3-hydroxyacyl-CoA dehydrogenase / enoyl-CoA hydratase / 3-hydroxybutyryl-CoA epimerase
MKTAIPPLHKASQDSPEGSGGRLVLRRRLHLELDERGVACVLFDHSGKTANLFDEATFDELEIALRAVEKLQARGLVFLSSKPGVFLAGADLEAFEAASEETLAALVDRGQNLFLRIAGLPIPTLAAIDGACLGGGLELALACDKRVASDDESTRIGLPETQLGIVPAWGGCTRLPRLVGVPAALKLVLGGKPVKAHQARRLGLVDRVVPKESLRATAIREVLAPRPKRPRHSFANHPLAGALRRSLGQKQILAKTRGHYPALLHALALVTRGANGPVAASLRREKGSLLELASSPQAANLIRLFHLQNRAKHYRVLSRESATSLPPVIHTAVVGAGVMGAGIAHWLSLKGHPVILTEIDRARLAEGLETLRKLHSQGVKRDALDRHAAARAMDLVAPTAESVPLGRCDLVVEAAVEDLEIKRRIFADLATRTREDAILATNTSALPLSELAATPGLTHPERLIGLHFFNPVSRMKLVEVISTEATSPEVLERALGFVRGLGKIPVAVKDSPGFLVNRILMPYLVEAGRLVEEGVPVETLIDRAMLDFGMPMGPLRLLDEVGLDVATQVAGTMSEAFGDRFAIPPILARLVSQGRLGRKTGRGFYLHPEGGHTRKSPLPDPELSASLSGGRSSERISDRLAALMAEEAQRCLDEGIARDADDIDLAMVLGTGYAPFRGGPLKDADRHIPPGQSPEMAAAAA